jgi:hypothetical protein
MGDYDGGLAPLRELLAGSARPIPEATFEEIDVLTAQAAVAYAQVRWADTPEGPVHSVDLLTRDRHLSISAGPTGLLGADVWPLTVVQVHTSHGEYKVTFQHGYALHVVETGEGDHTYATRTPADLMRWLSAEASWA